MIVFFIVYLYLYCHLWSWSYRSWIYNYLCNQCISPLTFFFNLISAHDDTTLCDKLCLCHKWPWICSTCRKHLQVLYFILVYKWLITRVTQQVSLVEHELPTLLEHLSSLPAFREVHVTRSLVFCVVFCRSLFVLMSVIFCSLCCLSFFDVQILNTPLPSSSSSCQWFRPVGAFLWALKFPPTIKLTATI